ncbi:hypothetical protein ACEWY4_026056 [Coilia grayii]|uniref:IRG-type G domain-containing protein n=1 Tax=Coilia grayii TaxID=363190 RepID=A0ABD1ITS5_9TELE
MESQLAEVHSAISQSGESTFEGAEAKAKLELQELNNVTLNIAVTGVTGAGKSSFVNALRGVQDYEEGAAPTGVEETTMTPIMYRHPTMPNVNIWDLPGIGTENFKASEYIKNVNLNTYDFFFILTSTRLHEHDIMLAKEIKKNKKNFYFIRTKVDQDVDAEKRKGKTEEQTLSLIRHALEEKLKDLGSTHIFLVSSWELHKFDFNKLICVLEKDLPDNKRNALIQSLSVYSMEILDKKYNTFKKAIWFSAFASGAVGAIPVPGVSAAFDLPMIAGFLTSYYFSFGLDERSLTKLSERVNKPILANIHESKLIKALAKRSMACLAIELSSFVALEGLEAALKVIPILGSVTGAVMSFTTTLLVLRKGLDELYRAAKEVVEMAGLE